MKLSQAVGAGRNSLLWDKSSVKPLSLLEMSKGCVNIREWVGVFRVSVHHWLELRCLECFICIKRNARC